MLGPFTFTFTLESEEFEKSEKVAAAAADFYQTMITTRAPDGANNVKSCKKINETAQMANFTDFPLIFCGRGPKWTKTMQTRTFFSFAKIF